MYILFDTYQKLLQEKLKIENPSMDKLGIESIAFIDVISINVKSSNVILISTT